MAKFMVLCVPPHAIEYLNNKNETIERNDITVRWIGNAENDEEAWKRFVEQDVEFIEFVKESGYGFEVLKVG